MAVTEHYQTVCDYVVKNYPRYKDQELIVIEKDNLFMISKHTDESPLILSKGILG